MNYKVDESQIWLQSLEMISLGFVPQHVHHVKYYGAEFFLLITFTAWCESSEVGD